MPRGCDCGDGILGTLSTVAHQTLRWWYGAMDRKNIEELSVPNVRVKFRAGIAAGNWKRHGKNLLQDCAENMNPVLLVIDELPIFLRRMLQHD